MPTLKAEDLRSLSLDELKDREENLRKEIFQLRVDAKLSKLENLMKVKQTRRDLARVLTVRQELGSEAQAQPQSSAASEKKLSEVKEKAAAKLSAEKKIKGTKKNG